MSTDEKKTEAKPAADAPKPKKMIKRVIIKLTKHYGNNHAGETCGFDPEVAEHILRPGGDGRPGGEKIREIEVEAPKGPGNIRAVEISKALEVAGDELTAARVVGGGAGVKGK